MKTNNILKVYIILALTLCTSGISAQRSKTNIDRNWTFLYGDGSEAVSDYSVTSSWRTLDLPHDWSVETEAAAQAGGTVIGPFSSNSVGKYQTGHTVGGEGWYAKTLRLTQEDLGKQLTLYFEGAYNYADVYINGYHVYFNPYGYSSFRIDVTDALAEGENHLLVRVRNEGNNTRWYAGSGIYRHVWLIATERVYAEEWDSYVETTANTTAKVSTIIHNAAAHPADCTIGIDILDSNRSVVASTEQTATVKPREEQAVSATLSVNMPKTWTPETPNLYTARITVTDKTAGTTDVMEKRFGFRTLSFSATEGFLLNGVSTLLRGGCVHHDNGLLGAAAYDAAEDRKLQLLKNEGYNAVRCSHNLPSEHFLDACDSLGLMVIDETFDQWLYAKNSNDYHKYFSEFSDRDLQVMLRRDRNHPSIIMWSIGNEIPGRIEPAGKAAAARMRATVRAYDTTRPITAAICGWDQGDAWNAAASNWDAQDNNAFESLDVGGYNYMYDKYEHDHGTHPDRVMCGLESYPKLASQNWDIVEDKPYVVGDFVWTAMDYLGEAGIGCASSTNTPSMFQGWPYYNGWCGDIDLIGQKKPQSYYRDVVWRQKAVTMAVQPTTSYNNAWGWQLEEQSWTWPGYEGKNVTVNVYSRAAKVRLYLNGVSQGDRTPGSTYWAGYTVPYTAGTLRVVNLDSSGNEIEGEDFTLKTTGEPAALRLTADRSNIRSNGEDLCYVTIELVDADGEVITSNSDMQVALDISGEGTLLAAGNASPTDMASFRSNTPKLFRGRALAILKSTDSEGATALTVTADGLSTQTIDITTSVKDHETAVFTVPAQDINTNNAIYDLMGRRLTRKPVAGIYIQNGRKYLTK